MTARHRPRWTRLAAAFAIALATTAVAARETQTPARTPAPAAPAAEDDKAGAPGARGYSYNPEGRRDPFVSLLDRGSSDLKSATTSRPEGLAGLFVGDIAIRGVLLSRGAYSALIQAPDDKTYTIRPGDKLFDASVKAITADAVVFVQQVTDPLSLVKQREIRKPLRLTEEGK
jgi:Tfp pilus assembly protein PilP